MERHENHGRSGDDLYESYVRFVEDACEDILSSSALPRGNDLDDKFLMTSAPMSRAAFKIILEKAAADPNVLERVTGMLRNGYFGEVERRRSHRGMDRR